jgi:hypothetical protein
MCINREDFLWRGFTFSALMIWALSFEEWIFVLISWVLPETHEIKRMFVGQFYLRNSIVYLKEKV